MRKLMLLFAVMALVVVACQSDSDMDAPTTAALDIDMSDFYVYTDTNLSEKTSGKSEKIRCFSMEVLNRQLKENPGLYQKMYNVEKHTRNFIATKGGKPDKPGKTE